MERCALPCIGPALTRHTLYASPLHVVQVVRGRQAQVQEGLRVMLADGRLATPQLLEEQEKAARDGAARADRAQDLALDDAGGSAF